jgi:competence ComEA-like helix-hairpin-helix protein
LLLVIALLQVGYFVFTFFSSDVSTFGIRIDEETQTQVDGLKQKALKKDTLKIYPFNPNFITDYKGYALGMSIAEIDKLHAFRSQNNYVNSPEGFQQVTLISDSLLNIIAPYFKFPEGTQKKSKQYSANSRITSVDHKSSPLAKGLREDFSDLNAATAEDLKAINGIGDKLSTRIVKFRNRLGGFLIDEQLTDVYGLKPEVIERVLLSYKVLERPKIKKININTASEEELAKLVYITYETAQNIIEYRNNNGNITSFDELKKIDGFPSDKIDRIVLYLRL